MMSNTLIERLRPVRLVNIRLIDSTPRDKLTVIPRGFSHNLLWVAGHLVATQMSLLYRRTGQTPPLPESFHQYFARGTSPAAFDTKTPAFEEIRSALSESVSVLERDYDRLNPLSYIEPITVSTGHRIGTFIEALEFLPLHEAYHFGGMTMLKKFL